MTTSFGGGLNTADNLQFLPEGAYGFAQNVRLAGGTLEPIKAPVKQTVPPGNINASFSFGRWIVLVVDGIIWYRDVTAELVFERLPDIQLQAPIIHGCIIPSKYLNFKRVLVDSKVARAFSAAVRTTDAGLFLTDGITQPVVVYPTAKGLWARETAKRSAFTADNNEYVPLGRFPHWTGSKLLLVQKDKSGKYTQIVQSVTGEPLNFAVIIDDQGMPAGEGTLPYNIGPDEIIGIRKMPEDSFLVQTLRESVVVVPDFESLFFQDFNEPSYRAVRRFDIGSSGLNAALEARGRDIVFVSRYGIHSINAIQERQTRQVLESFGGDIHNIFSDGSQTDPAVVAWDDELLFAVNTRYGQCVLVYDMYRSRFVSIDNYGIGTIKNFLAIAADEDDRLFVQTEDALFELFAGNEPLTASVYVGEAVTAGMSYIQRVVTQFISVTSETAINVRCFSDQIQTSDQTRVRGEVIQDSPVAFPLASSGARALYDEFTCVTLTANGSTHGALITWNGDATLAQVSFVTAQPTTLPYTSNVTTTKYLIHGGSDASVYQTFESFQRFVGCGYYQELWTTAQRDFDLKACGPTDATTLPFTVGHFSRVDGDVEFFFLCLTPNYGAGTTSGSVQYKWLEQALAISTARWKIIVCPVYPPANEAYQWPFKSWGAHLVLSASEPNYQRHMLNDGLHYINSGCSTRTPSVSEVVSGGISINNRVGSTVLEVSAAQLTVYFVDQRQDSVIVIR